MYMLWYDASLLLNHLSHVLQGKSVTALKMLFEEIMEIFPDEYIHFGADEIGFNGNCNFESKIISHFDLHAPFAKIVAYALAPNFSITIISILPYLHKFSPCKLF